MSVLLAKKPKDPNAIRPEETLPGHTISVLRSAEKLAEILSDNITRVTQCNSKKIVYWTKALLLSAWIHDWGKANNHFLGMLMGSNNLQGIRHETLSFLLAADILKDWLEPVFMALPQWAQVGALVSVSGHHLKFPDPVDNRPGTSVTIFTGHEDFRKTLQIGADYFGLGPVPSTRDFEYSLLSRGNLRKSMLRLEREMDSDFVDGEKVLVAALKATLMCADLAGSALPFHTEDVSGWLSKRLSRVLHGDQLTEVGEKRLCGNPPRRFQKAVQEAAEMTVLVEAGCGSGKTVAAYLWAAGRVENRRLFFCYPTRATASEGFAGYLHDPDFEAILIHSRSLIDYQLLGNMPIPGHEETELREMGLEALETWPIPAVVCTAHTVLGIMENIARGIYAWPSIARSVFIFDEIHAFSRRLFNYLLRFLETFPGAPILLMTATLPPARKAALERSCRVRGGLRVIKGPEKREKALRYILMRSTEEEAWETADRVIRDGGKVLWICNTINRCLGRADYARNSGLPVCVFHSRFRYKDRLERQRELIDGFEASKPAMLAVATQAAEMSLDLSADLLVTEYAPIPGMIQRLGRLNRFEETPVEVKPALFIKPENHLPYKEEEMNGVDDWLTSVCDGLPKSQRDLAEIFIQMTAEQDTEISPAPRCEWVDGLWMSLKNRRSIEEASFSVEVIREEDLDGFSPAANSIPMPFPTGNEWRGWRRQGRYLIAPSGMINYDPRIGAAWKKH